MSTCTVKSKVDRFFPIPIYTRVTEILAPFSGMDKIDRCVLERAGIRGTEVHKNIEFLQKGELFQNLPEEWQGYIDSYNMWSKDKNIIETQRRMFDDELMLTGEFDCLYLDGNELTLVDFKTSVSEGKTWKYQGSAYSYLAKNKGHNVTRIEFVRLSKEGREPKSYFYQEDMPRFLQIFSLYREFFGSQKDDVVDL